MVLSWQNKQNKTEGETEGQTYVTPPQGIAPELTKCSLFVVYKKMI